MNTSILEPVEPTLEDREMAARAIEELPSGHVNLVELPGFVVTIIEKVLQETASGHALSVMPIDMDMSISEAASYLNVSAQTLLMIIDEGGLSPSETDTGKRLDFKMLRAYKEQADAKAYELLGMLQDQAQELGLGY